MAKITNTKTLKAEVRKLYNALRAAMIEHQRKPFENRRNLERNYNLVARMARLNGIEVKPLPIPKSKVQGAPEITTPAAKKKKAKTPVAPRGDVLATNATDDK